MNVDVTISIVSMNNEILLTGCLNSILHYTENVRVEIYVLAYLFDKNKLNKIKDRYKDVIFVENDEITGFGENHNILLEKANGKYLLVLNDDVYFEENMVKQLFHTFENLKSNVAFLSPVIYFPSGITQFNGREKYTWFDYIITKLHLNNLIKRKNIYSDKEGIYRTYNISGACFMTRSSIFKSLGYFDEYYFFCPEDIAISTKANKAGYQAYVNTDISIFHIHEASSSAIKAATGTVETLGLIHFLGTSLITNILLKLFTILQLGLKFSYLIFFMNIKNNHIKRNLIFWTSKYLFSNKSPKEIFKVLYLMSKSK